MSCLVVVLQLLGAARWLKRWVMGNAYFVELRKTTEVPSASTRVLLISVLKCMLVQKFLLFSLTKFFALLSSRSWSTDEWSTCFLLFARWQQTTIGKSLIRFICYPMRSVIAPKSMLAPQYISCVGATPDSKAVSTPPSQCFTQSSYLVDPYTSKNCVIRR